MYAHPAGADAAPPEGRLRHRGRLPVDGNHGQRRALPDLLHGSRRNGFLRRPLARLAAEPVGRSRRGTRRHAVNPRRRKGLRRRPGQSTELSVQCSRRRRQQFSYAVHAHPRKLRKRVRSLENARNSHAAEGRTRHSRVSLGTRTRLRSERPRFSRSTSAPWPLSSRLRSGQTANPSHAQHRSVIGRVGSVPCHVIA